MKFLTYIKDHNMFTQPEPKRSRCFFTFEGICATMISILTSGAIFAGYLDFLGIPEQYNGLVLAIPIAANFLQPLGAFFFDRLHRKKPLFLILLFLHRSMLSLMYLVPLLVPQTGLRITVLLGLFVLSNLLVALPASVAPNWIYHLTTNQNRGKYLALRERFMILSSALVGFGAGIMIDYFKQANNPTGGYIVTGILILLATFGNSFGITQLKSGEPPPLPHEKRQSLWKSFFLPFKEKSFRPVLLISIMYQIAVNMFCPYWGIYQVNTLKLPYAFITALSFFAAVEKTAVVSLWNRFSSRTSWAFCTLLMMSIMAFSSILNVFTLPSSAYYMTIISCVIGQLSWATVNLCFFNLQFECAPQENRSVFLGINAALNGVFGFIGVLIAGFLMNFANRMQLTFLGAPLKGQQLQNALGACLLFFAAAYTYRVFKRRGTVMRFPSRNR